MNDYMESTVQQKMSCDDVYHIRTTVRWQKKIGSGVNRFKQPISKHEIEQILLVLINIKTNRSCFLLSTHFVTISSH